MSDSDDDYELDFITSATNKTKEAISSQIIKDSRIPKPSASLQKNLKPEDVASKRSNPFEEKSKIGRKDTKTLDVISDDEIYTESAHPRSSIDSPVLTPPRVSDPAKDEEKRPGRPTAKKRARGTKISPGFKQTIKTTKALKKLSAMRLPGFLDVSAGDEVLLVEQENAEEGQFMLKIQWKHEIIRLEVGKSEKLGPIFDKIAEKIGQESLRLNFFFGEARLKREETVAGSGINITSIIEARCVYSSEAKVQIDHIEVKLQTQDRKNSVVLKVRVNETMRSVAEKYAEMQKLESADRVRFFFDGMEVGPRDTPETLDFEGGECVDVLLK